MGKTSNVAVTKTPDNAELHEKMFEIINLGLKDKLLEKFIGIKELIENFCIDKYNNIPISESQLYHLKYLIKNSKIGSRNFYPLAEALYAMYTAKRGPEYSAKADALFDQLHIDHPLFKGAFIEHYLFLSRESERYWSEELHAKMDYLDQQIDYLEIQEQKAREQSIRRYQEPAILTKPKSSFFNPIVGSGRPSLFQPSSAFKHFHESNALDSEAVTPTP